MFKNFVNKSVTGYTSVFLDLISSCKKQVFDMDSKNLQGQCIFHSDIVIRSYAGFLQKSVKTKLLSFRQKRCLLIVVVGAAIAVTCMFIFQTMWSLELYIATFRLLTTSLHQAMRSTGYLSPYVSRWSVVSSMFALV